MTTQAMEDLPNKPEIKLSGPIQLDEDTSQQYLLAVGKLNDESSQDEIERAINDLNAIAEQGYEQAWIALGHYYMDIGKDAKKGIACFEKAANNDFAEALLMLGKCFYRGFGVEKDYREAFKYFRRAVNLGSVDANYYLGMCYCHGRGIKKSFILAAQCFSKKYGPGFIDHIALIGDLPQTQAHDLENKNNDEVSLHNNAEIQLMLGHCYYHGVGGVEKNGEKALECFEKAAEYGEKNVSLMLNFLGLQLQDDKLADRAFELADKLEPPASSAMPSSAPITDAPTLATFPINTMDIQIVLRRYHISKGFFRKGSKLFLASSIKELESLLQNTSYFDDQKQLNADGFNALVNILLSTTQGKQSHLVLDKIRGKLGNKYTCFERLKELKLIAYVDSSKLHTLSGELLNDLLDATECLSKSKPSLLNPSNFMLLYNTAFNQTIRTRLKYIPTIHSANMLNLENLKEILAEIPHKMAQKIEEYSFVIEQCEIPLPVCLFRLPEAGTYTIQDIKIGRKQFFRDAPRGNSEERLMLIKQLPLPALLFSAFKQDDKEGEDVSHADQDGHDVLELKSDKNHPSIQYIIDNLGVEGAKELFLTFTQNYFSTIGMLMTPFLRHKYKDEEMAPPKVESTVTNIDMVGNHLHVTCWNNKFIVRAPDKQTGNCVEKGQLLHLTATNVIHEMQLVTNESKQTADNDYQFIQSFRTDSIVLARDLFNVFCVNRLKDLQEAEKEFKYSDISESQNDLYPPFLVDVYKHFSTADKDTLNSIGLLECLDTLKKVSDDQDVVDMAFGYIYVKHKRSELLKKTPPLLQSTPISEVSHYSNIKEVIDFLKSDSELSYVDMQLQRGKDIDSGDIPGALKMYHQKLRISAQLIAKINKGENISDSLLTSDELDSSTSSNSLRSSSFSYSNSGSSSAAFFTGSSASEQLPEIQTSKESINKTTRTEFS